VTSIAAYLLYLFLRDGLFCLLIMMMLALFDIAPVRWIAP